MIWNIQYFKPEELLSPDGLAQFANNNFMLNPTAVASLVRMREIIDQPIMVNHGNARRRGFRSQKENQAVGGGNCSRHLQGLAFDCTPKDMNLVRFASIALNQGWGGVGIYLDMNFVHIDRRPIYNNKIALWAQDNQKIGFAKSKKVSIARVLDSKTISSYDIKQTEDLLNTLLLDL